MIWGNTRVRYGAVAMTLHWLLAALILFMLALGLFMTSLDEMDPRTFPLFQIHKSIGLTILILTLLRLAWRLSNPIPSLPSGMRGWERLAARGTHALFYVLMIAIPLMGWATVSAAPLAVPTMWFGLFEWPHIPFLADLPRVEKRMIEGPLATTHAVLALSMLGLALLHVGAALKHQFRDRDDVLKRMLPWTKLPT
jgi:cytochrome b561